MEDSQLDTSTVGTRAVTLSARALFVIHALVAVAMAVGWVIVRGRGPWGDEVHFLGTVRRFGDGVSMDLLRSYQEMSGPLTFVLYSGWGRLVGFETQALRLLSPLIAFATAYVWLRVLLAGLRDGRLVLLVFGSLLLNPYFVGLSLFVFTDMLALLGLALATFGVWERRPWLTASGLAIATCSRQYLAFLAPALVLTGVFSRRDLKPVTRLVIPSLVGMIPLAALIALWGGNLAPANQIRDLYLSEGLRFDVHSLSLYLSSPAAYLVFLVAPTAIRASRTSLSLAFGVALLVAVFPVLPSSAQLREGVTTVGFLHRAMSALLSEWWVRVVVCLLAFVNTTALAEAATEAAHRWRSGALPERELFVWVAIAAFLAVMPFSYMPWEKYALPLLMLQSLALGMLLDRRLAANSSQSVPA